MDFLLDQHRRAGQQEHALDFRTCRATPWLDRRAGQQEHAFKMALVPSSSSSEADPSLLTTMDSSSLVYPLSFSHPLSKAQQQQLELILLIEL